MTADKVRSTIAPPLILSISFRHDLLVLSVLSLFLPLLIGFRQLAVLRIILGLFYIILFPGYTLIAAIFPSRDCLNWLERLGLSLALSVSVVSFTGFLLNYSPWGIKLDPLLISLTSLVLLTCVIAYYRREKLSPKERFILCIRLELPRWQMLSRLDSLLTLILVLSLTATIVAVIYTAIMPGPQEEFTEFYVLGLNRELGEHPKRIAIGESVTIILGLVNYEHTEVQYHIEKTEDKSTERIASPRLGHDEKWEQTYAFTLTEPGKNHKVTFLLYKGDDEEPCRLLHLWITVKEKPTPIPTPTPEPEPTSTE